MVKKLRGIRRPFKRFPPFRLIHALIGNDYAMASATGTIVNAVETDGSLSGVRRHELRNGLYNSLLLVRL